MDSRLHSTYHRKTKCVKELDIILIYFYGSLILRTVLILPMWVLRIRIRNTAALINPTITTTGKYKCEVQTASNIFFRYHRIQVIDLSNYSLDLFHNKIPNGTQLECVLSNMYPGPFWGFCKQLSFIRVTRSLFVYLPSDLKMGTLLKRSLTYWKTRMVHSMPLPLWM